MGVLLLVKSDTKQYGTLIKDTKNQYTRGMDGYPRSMISGYDMLTNFRNPQAALRLHNQDSGLGICTR